MNDSGIPEESRLILELAQSDGWHALYDPTNPAGRRLSDGMVTGLKDLLGNLPEAVAQDGASPPRWDAEAFNGSGATSFGDSGAVAVLSTGHFAAALGQPTFILALGQSRTARAGDRGSFLIDSGSALSRHAIYASGTSADRWAVYAGNEYAAHAVMDTRPHVFGFMVNGPYGEEGSRFYLDGQPQDGEVFGDNSRNVRGLSGITFGCDHVVSADRFWDGFLGPVLVYKGIPQQSVRERMTRLLLSRIVPPQPVLIDRLNSDAAILVNEDRTVAFAKNPDELHIPASMTKMLTAYLIRTVLTDDRLAQTTVLGDDDNLEGSLPQLRAGDIISYGDLLHLAMLPSHNVAVNILVSRLGSEFPGSGLPRRRFDTAIAALVDAWGWEGAVFRSPSGISTANKTTARQMAELLWRIHDEDPALLEIMGKASHEIPVGGLTPRTVVARHTIQRNRIPALPDFVAGKTGLLLGVGGTVAMLMDGIHGRQVVVTMSAQPPAERLWDARAIVDGRASTWASSSPAIVSTENRLLQALENPHSASRQALDARYASIAGPCAKTTVPIIGDDIPENTQVRLSRTSEGLVEMQIAGVRLPQDLVTGALVPVGYRPHRIAYGACTMRSQDSIGLVEVLVRPNGTLEFRGNEQQLPLRGTLTWLTSDPGPRR